MLSLQPPHLCYLLGSGPVAPPDFEDAPHKADKLEICGVLEVELSAVDHPLELSVGLSLEGVSPLGQRVDHHSIGPDIGLLANVLLATYDLGSHVVGRTAYHC